MFRLRNEWLRGLCGGIAGKSHGFRIVFFLLLVFHFVVVKSEQADGADCIVPSGNARIHSLFL